MTYKRTALVDQFGDEQILVAVVVEIAGVHAHVGFSFAVRAERHAGLDGGVRERPVMLIDPELVFLLVVGHEEIEPAVAIEVGRNGPERPAERLAQAGGDRHIREFPAAQIPVEVIRLRPIDVRPAVVRLA